MPFNAFVVYAGDDNNKIVGFGLTQAQATARSLEGVNWVAHQGQVMDIPDLVRSDGDWQFVTQTGVVQRIPLTTADVIGQNRAILKSLLQEKERIEGLAAWTAGELNDAELLDDRKIGRRGKSFVRWVEMMARASAVDGNLSDPAKFAVVLAEASIPGRVWYWLHYLEDPPPDPETDRVGSPWVDQSIFTDSNRDNWGWYSTLNNNVATPNSRGASPLMNSISLAAGSDFNWIAYLG